MVVLALRLKWETVQLRSVELLCESMPIILARRQKLQFCHFWMKN